MGSMHLNFIPIHMFRETPQVSFFDASVPNSNGTDVVVHKGPAISPPDDGEEEQYYVHYHQVDNNLVLTGRRRFALLNLNWSQPHHIVHLERAMGALQIPAGTFHRSESPEEGSMVLNLAIRDPKFDYATEFLPVSMRNRDDLKVARHTEPWVWSWHNGHIRRHHGDKPTP